MKFIGLAVVLVCVFAGYTLGGGHMAVILEAIPFEGMTIIGAAIRRLYYRQSDAPDQTDRQGHRH